MTKYTNTGNKDTRSGFGEGLLAAGRECNDVVALSADLMGSVKMDGFAKEFPQRFFQCGIAEANMINVAAGLSLNGKIPFVGTFAAFATGRVYDQVRMAVAYSETNVKIAASHAGITLGEDGATHQILEDIGLMRMLPGMVVINPCDFNQTKNATIAAAMWKGPVYLRFGRPSVPNFTPENQTFEIGKAYKLNEGKDVSIFATGHLVWEALLAAEELEKEGMSSLILDLRSNPGGLVDSCAEIASQMLPEGMIAYSETKDGRKFEWKSDGKHEIKIPVVILVNSNTASAAEILTGAMKDYGKATIIGTTTFGKGIIQNTYGLGDGTAVEFTVGQYYLPQGETIHEKGISPDIEIELDAEAYLKDGSDNQLDAALKELRK